MEQKGYMKNQNKKFTHNMKDTHENGGSKGGLKVKTVSVWVGLWVVFLTSIFKCYVGYDYFDFKKTF